MSGIIGKEPFGKSGVIGAFASAGIIVHHDQEKVSMSAQSGRETTNQQKLVVGSAIKVGCGNHTPPAGAAGNFFGIDIQQSANNVAQMIKKNTHSEGCFYFISGQYASKRWADVICTSHQTVWTIDTKTVQGASVTRSYSISAEALYLTMNDSSNSYSVFITAMGANECPTNVAPSPNAV